MSAEITQLAGGLLKVFGLFGLALAVGGIAWSLVVLRAWRAAPSGQERPVAAAANLAALGAGLLALAQLLHLAARAHIISEELGRSPFPQVLLTTAFQAGIARAAAALLLALALLRIARKGPAPARWLAAGGIAVIACVSGAWLTHGASRIDDRLALMVLGTVHQAAGAAWIGGVVHVLAFRRLTRRDAAAEAEWSRALARFSPLGIAAVLLLVATGAPQAWHYVGTLAGLIGTAYGSVLTAKWTLLAAALVLAALNFRAARRWRSAAAEAADRRRLETATPHLVEAEAAILGVVLFAAATLSSLPPSVDIPEQRASFAEVVHMFEPKMPRLVSPSIADVRRAEAESMVAKHTEPGPEEFWSDFNHNVAGVIVLMIGLAALADRTGRVPWARQWPLGFLVLAVFVLIRADNEVWPYGDTNFFEALQEANTLQHKLAFALTAGLGVMEWRARRAAAIDSRLPYVFPVLCFAGGILMLTHSHSAFELKADFLQQASHTAIGLLAVAAGCARWLELRLGMRAGRLAGHAAAVALVLVGAVLAFYREPLG